VLFVSVTTWTNAITRTVYGLVSLFLLTSFYYWSAEGFNIKYEAFLTSKNILGAILFSSVFLLAYAKLVDNHILIRKSFVPLLAMCLALLWATASRGSQLSLLVSLIAYILWPLITRNKMSQVLTFVFFFAGTVSTVYFYLGMSQFGFFVALQDIFQQYTFAPLYSGREFVWPIIVDQIYQKPILGWGAGFREEEIVYNPEQGALSTHNLYLAVTLQSGLVGAGFLMGLLYSIWSAFCVAKTDPVVRLSGAFFLGICINQWFNLSLIQNNVSIGVLFWLVIGIGLNRAILATRWGLHYETKPQTPS
jgi:O-antigen ligase